MDSNTFTSAGGADSGTSATSKTIHPSIENGLWKVVVDNATNSNWHNWSHKNNIEDNFSDDDDFTFSFEIKSSNSVNSTPPKIYFKSGMGYYVVNGTVSSEWSRCYYSGKWKDTNGISFHFGWNGLQRTYYIRKLKFERGNIATDWSPAPEDSDNVISQDTAPKDTSAVWFNTHDNLFYKYNGEDWIAVSDYNEDIIKLKEDVGKIDSTIDGKINSYNEEIKNNYYTKAQVDSQIETNERGIKEYYSGTLQTIKEDTTGLSNRITAIEGYIQKGLDDNGQPFVELGTQASPYKLKITNDAIQITYLGEPVSNWKQDLIELNTVITSYLNLGKFSFVINSDDSLSFRKIR